MGHAEGRTIFVSLAAPGDVARVRIDRTRGKIAFASIVELVEPSPDRVDPLCPYFGRCGGCDFQQLSYRAQLDAKVEIIRDCLRRIAGLASPPEISITPSPNEWRYRSRANWQVESVARPLGRAAGITSFEPSPTVGSLPAQSRKVGYFERGSHVVCDVEDCVVLDAQLELTLETVREVTHFPDSLSEVDAVAGDEGVSLTPPIGSYGPVEVTRMLAGETYTFSAAAFFQINHALLEALIASALKDQRGTKAVDLYCGVGLFTLPLARRFFQVIAVEGNLVSASFASRNLRDADLNNCIVVDQPVERWLESNVDTIGVVDFLVVDPPRSGIEKEARAGLAQLRPRRIGYVSCDPATLARDLKDLFSAGYSLDSIAAFDMFPQTHHVETVVHLTCNARS